MQFMKSVTQETLVSIFYSIFRRKVNFAYFRSEIGIFGPRNRTWIKSLIGYSISGGQRTSLFCIFFDVLEINMSLKFHFQPHPSHFAVPPVSHQPTPWSQTLLCTYVQTSIHDLFSIREGGACSTRSLYLIELKFSGEDFRIFGLSFSCSLERN